MERGIFGKECGTNWLNLSSYKKCLIILQTMIERKAAIATEKDLFKERCEKCHLIRKFKTEMKTNR